MSDDEPPRRRASLLLLIQDVCVLLSAHLCFTLPPIPRVRPVASLGRWADMSAQRLEPHGGRGEGMSWSLGLNLTSCPRHGDLVGTLAATLCDISRLFTSVFRTLTCCLIFL